MRTGGPGPHRKPCDAGETLTVDDWRQRLAQRLDQHFPSADVAKPIAADRTPPAISAGQLRDDLPG